MIGLHPGSFRLLGVTSMALLFTVAAVAHSLSLLASAVTDPRGRSLRANSQPRRSRRPESGGGDLKLRFSAP